jgi:Fem-1 family protein b
VLNNIFFGDSNTSQHMCFDVSILWAASVMNNFKIVKLLVEHEANVNHTTKTNSTPFRGASYHGNVDMARYLIKNGADIHITKENNETHLMMSVCFKRIEMVAYLVDELCCDVNVCDNNGRTSLYDAVYCKSLELVEFLLKHGARNFPATLDQMSPLMWAAETMCVDIVETISPYCSLVERIEAEELLGSAFICFQVGNHDLAQSFEHFYRALELRITHNLPKALRPNTIDIFDNRQEYQTLNELENIRSNIDDMYTEALLVRERLLGPTNEKYRNSLLDRGALLADNGQHNRAHMFMMHELELHQQYAISLDSDKLRLIVSHTSEMLFKSMPIPIDALLILLTLINEELDHKNEFDYNIFTLLFLVTIITQVHI